MIKLWLAVIYVNTCMFIKKWIRKTYFLLNILLMMYSLLLVVIRPLYMLVHRAQHLFASIAPICQDVSYGGGIFETSIPAQGHVYLYSLAFLVQFAMNYVCNRQGWNNCNWYYIHAFKANSLIVFLTGWWAAFMVLSSGSIASDHL